jgi:hypothetical protein
MMLGFGSYFGNAGAPMMWRVAGSFLVAAAAAGAYAFFPFQQYGLVSAKAQSRVDSSLLTYLILVALFAYAAPESVETGDTWEPYVAIFAIPLGGVALVLLLGALGVGRLFRRMGMVARCGRCASWYQTKPEFCVVCGASIPYPELEALGEKFEREIEEELGELDDDDPI